MENCVNKFLKALGEDTNLERDAFSEYIAFHGLGDTYSKRWLANIVPADVLRLSLKEAVNIIATLSESGYFYNKFPDYIYPPDYGHNWGRLANYIEINNRAIAYMDNGCTCRGIESAIKLLPLKAGQIVLFSLKYGRIFSVMPTKKGLLKKIQFTESG